MGTSRYAVHARAAMGPQCALLCCAHSTLLQWGPTVGRQLGELRAQVLSLRSWRCGADGAVLMPCLRQELCSLEQRPCVLLLTCGCKRL